MKLFKKTTPRKSWSIKLIETEASHVCLWAVDSQTGESLAAVLGFPPYEPPVLFSGCSIVLQNKGYDPDEHGHLFDDNGRLIING